MEFFFVIVIVIYEEVMKQMSCCMFGCILLLIQIYQIFCSLVNYPTITIKTIHLLLLCNLLPHRKDKLATLYDFVCLLLLTDIQVLRNLICLYTYMRSFLFSFLNSEIWIYSFCNIYHFPLILQRIALYS